MAKRIKEKSNDAGDLRKVFDNLNKALGEGAIFIPSLSGPVKSVPRLETGMVSLDLALGGGVPLGRIIEIYGPESSGKTSLAAFMAGVFQKSGKIVGIVDAEHSMDPSWFNTLGVDVDSLVINQPASGEDALHVVQAMVETKQFGLVIVDSVAALTPRAELDGEMGDSHVGLQARLMSQAMRKLTAMVASSSTSIIFTNQIRMKIGISYGNPETTPGGNALKFYASMRLYVRGAPEIKDGGEDPTRSKVAVTVVKNKVAPPKRKADLFLNYASGFDLAADILTFAVDLNIVQKRGAWYSYGEENLGCGHANVSALLRNNPELLNKIRTEVIKCLQAS